MIRLNETQLKRIIAESVRKAINEIGDTPEGRKNLYNLKGKALDKMSNLGRNEREYMKNRKEIGKREGQYRDIDKYLDNANQEAFGGDDCKVTNTSIKYDIGRNMKVIVFFPNGDKLPYGHVRYFALADAPGGDMYGLERALYEDYFKTPNKKTAKTIADWIKEKYDMYIDDEAPSRDLKLYGKATDWRTWYASGKETGELDEIGDTPEGRKGIRNAISKATDKGRLKQAMDFEDYLDDVSKDEFGEGANANYYVYRNAFNDKVVLYGNKDEVVADGDGYSWENMLESRSIYFKTYDKSVARKIAKWVVEQPIYEKLQNLDVDVADWHTWAAQ